MNKKDLSERDICSKFIGPAVKRAGWDGMLQIREEVAFTKGRIIVRGKLVSRGKAKRAAGQTIATGDRQPSQVAFRFPRTIGAQESR
jgi:type I site-specific restriction endonuclease